MERLLQNNEKVMDKECHPYIWTATVKGSTRYDNISSPLHKAFTTTNSNFAASQKGKLVVHHSSILEDDKGSYHGSSPGYCCDDSVAHISVVSRGMSSLFTEWWIGELILSSSSSLSVSRVQPSTNLPCPCPTQAMPSNQSLSAPVPELTSATLEEADFIKDALYEGQSGHLAEPNTPIKTLKKRGVRRSPTKLDNNRMPTKPDQAIDVKTKVKLQDTPAGSVSQTIPEFIYLAIDDFKNREAMEAIDSDDPLSPDRHSSYPEEGELVEVALERISI